MANTKDIRIKIASTIKTQQTTKAMKMVSAAKLRRAQSAIVNARPYAYRIRGIIKRIADSHQLHHKLLTTPEVKGKMLLVVLSSDRGLCGGFNNNIIKYTRAFYESQKSLYPQIDFLFIGRRAADFFKKREVHTIETITNLAHDIKYSLAASIAERVLQSYLADEYTEIRFIYNEFKSAISQKVVDEVLLPLSKAPAEDLAAEPKGPTYSRDFLFEPDAEQIVDQLLVKHFSIQVHRCMQESLASEHGARMAAMESATKNAGDRIRSLTLTYNKIRQAAITTELIEITSGAEALKG
jgi:F-type H+-transporting ATPase subunit gamma